MKFCMIFAGLLALGPAAYAEPSVQLIECVVSVSGQDLSEEVVLDREIIELKSTAELTWIGSVELQIDPTRKHPFRLRKTEAPGIDLITQIANGMEFGFFGVNSVEVSFEQNGYATKIVCVEKSANN